jgi:formate hydrogenlyase subunit 4
MNGIIAGIIYLIGAPILGCLITGLDRKITARMQRRKGPPLLQPFYDVVKLFQKRTVVTNSLQLPLMICHLVFVMFSGFLFFEGTDILLTLFVMTVAELFLVLTAFSSSEPYSFIGAERELIMSMAYEPMIVLVLVGFFKASGSFHFADIAQSATPVILQMPLLFLGLIWALTIKFRKSPFDISLSPHAHQELVRGTASDFSGSVLGIMEISEWYDKIFLMGFVYLFFGFMGWWALVPVALVYFLEILIDNSSARLSWQYALKSSWIVALVLGTLNLIYFYIPR